MTQKNDKGHEEGISNRKKAKVAKFSRSSLGGDISLSVCSGYTDFIEFQPALTFATFCSESVFVSFVVRGAGASVRCPACS
jgi:hypothetical protein